MAERSDTRHNAEVVFLETRIAEITRQLKSRDMELSATQTALTKARAQAAVRRKYTTHGVDYTQYNMSSSAPLSTLQWYSPEPDLRNAQVQIRFLVACVGSDFPSSFRQEWQLNRIKFGKAKTERKLIPPIFVPLSLSRHSAGFERGTQETWWH